MASASPLMVQSPVPYGKAPTGPAGVGGVLTQLVRGAGPCKHMAAPPGHIGEAGQRVSSPQRADVLDE